MSNSALPITFDKTNRGFAIGTFTDRYDLPCEIQKSSLATEDAIWLGISDPQPKILASKARLFGIETSETTGWVPYPVPDEVLMHTRMHLTREQVAALLPILQNFVNTGNIGHPKTPK